MEKDGIEKHAETIIREVISVPFKWAHVVPIVVEMSVGEDWATQKDAGSHSTDDFFKKDSHRGSWADGENWEGMKRHAGTSRH